MQNGSGAERPTMTNSWRDSLIVQDRIDWYPDTPVDLWSNDSTNDRNICCKTLPTMGARHMNERKTPLSQKSLGTTEDVDHKQRRIAWTTTCTEPDGTSISLYIYIYIHIYKLLQIKNARGQEQTRWNTAHTSWDLQDKKKVSFRTKAKRVTKNCLWQSIVGKETSDGQLLYATSRGGWQYGTNAMVQYSRYIASFQSVQASIGNLCPPCHSFPNLCVIAIMYTNKKSSAKNYLQLS